MSSVQIYIVVEGQTEQTFVRDVLAPQLAHKGIYLYSAKRLPLLSVFKSYVKNAPTLTTG